MRLGSEGRRSKQRGAGEFQGLLRAGLGCRGLLEVARRQPKRCPKSGQKAAQSARTNMLQVSCETAAKPISTSCIEHQYPGFKLALGAQLATAPGRHVVNFSLALGAERSLDRSECCWSMQFVTIILAAVAGETSRYVVSAEKWFCCPAPSLALCSFC